MYRERGGCGSKVDIGAADRKRINDALDRHLERSSPSTSRGLNGKEKGRLSMPSVNSGKQPEHRTLSKSKLSDALVTDRESSVGFQGLPFLLPQLIPPKIGRRSKLTVIVRQQLPTVEINRYRPKVVGNGRNFSYNLIVVSDDRKRSLPPDSDRRRSKLTVVKINWH
ncbi:hypothetical protein B296_00043606 [Ensete ventricosum]|uniref:Uncharacterized protein n=1 Tax=Ensete ventricosum TaxID=4639 RepID=A0A426XKE7_ENSVE|nr:hypothetical protein B296_00043606 [Ensete ventricosum]